MPSEAKRGLIRIGANYTRIITGIVLSLALVPLLLQVVGREGWALIAFLGSTIGIPAMVQNIAGLSMIRELGVAHHSGNPDHFRSVYNASLAISLVIALVVLIAFGILWLVVPLLEIPADLVGAARWLVLARGAQTVVVLLTAAPFNMYKVSERMIAFNLWLTANRSCFVIAAVWLLILPSTDDPGRAITHYAILSSALVILTLLVATAIVIFIDRRLIPAPSTITRDATKTVLKIGGWNASATTVTMLYLRLGDLSMNLAFGLAGNFIFGIANRLADALRRITNGMTEGVDAVSARLSTTAKAGAIRALMHHSTRLHGLVAFPMAVLVVALSEPLLRLWIGKQLDSPEQVMPQVIVLTRILVIGITARAISDGWIRILYGAGYVSRYARLIMAGGLVYPLLVWVLLSVMGDASRYTAICWAYSFLMVTVHGVVLPIIGARALQISPGQFFVPLLRPLIIAVICWPILLAVRGREGQWELLWLLGTAGVYGCVYCGLCAAFVIEPAERQRVLKALMRRLPFRRPGRTDDMH